MNNVYCLLLDEVGDWKKKLFVIGGTIFAAQDLWEIYAQILEIKESILQLDDPDEEFKWHNITKAIREKTIEEEKIQNYVDVLVNLFREKAVSFLASVVELPKIIKWGEYMVQKQKVSKTRRSELQSDMEQWVREKATQDIIQRYYRLLTEDLPSENNENNVGFIFVDKFGGSNNKKSISKIESYYHKSIRQEIFQGDKYYKKFENIVPPFFVHSYMHNIFDLNDIALGAFSYVLGEMYINNGSCPKAYPITKKIARAVLQKIRKKQDDIWGYGLFDIPKVRQNGSLRQKIKFRNMFI